MTKSNLLILTAFTSLIVWSGICARLGYTKFSFWPWSHQWYMFSYSSDYVYKIRAGGYTNADVKVDIPLEDYFRYPASRLTHRADEIYPSRENLVSLANFLRDKNPDLLRIYFNSEIYYKHPGRHPDLTKSADSVSPLLEITYSSARDFSDAN